MSPEDTLYLKLKYNVFLTVDNNRSPRVRIECEHLPLGFLIYHGYIRPSVTPGYYDIVPEVDDYVQKNIEKFFPEFMENLLAYDRRKENKSDS